MYIYIYIYIHIYTHVRIVVGVRLLAEDKAGELLLLRRAPFVQCGDLATISPTISSEEDLEFLFVEYWYCQRGEIQVVFKLTVVKLELTSPYKLS